MANVSQAAVLAANKLFGSDEMRAKAAAIIQVAIDEQTKRLTGKLPPDSGKQPWGDPLYKEAMRLACDVLPVSYEQECAVGRVIYNAFKAQIDAAAPKWLPIESLKPSGRLYWFSDGSKVDFAFADQQDKLPFKATYFMPMRDYPAAPVADATGGQG